MKIIAFLAGFSGCVGSLRENTSFLAFYSTLLGLLLMLELAAAVYAYMCRDHLDNYIRNLFNDVVGVSNYFFKFLYRLWVIEMIPIFKFSSILCKNLGTAAESMEQTIGIRIPIFR